MSYIDIQLSPRDPRDGEGQRQEFKRDFDDALAEVMESLKERGEGPTVQENEAAEHERVDSQEEAELLDRLDTALNVADEAAKKSAGDEAEGEQTTGDAAKEILGDAVKGALSSGVEKVILVTASAAGGAAGPRIWEALTSILDKVF